MRTQAGPELGTLWQKLEVLTPQFPNPKIDFFSPLNCEIDSLDRTRKPAGSWDPSLVLAGQQLPILSPQGMAFQKLTLLSGSFPLYIKSFLVEAHQAFIYL